MKYVFIDERIDGIFTEEFDDEITAIKRAHAEWDHLSEHDKKQRTYFGVIESIDPDEDSDRHLEGWDVIRIV